MIGGCLLAGAQVLALVGGSFTLSWTHSVEKTGWGETYAVTAEGLKLTEARVQGSGAGMDPGPGAVLQDGWWVWKPTLPAVPELLLGDSGATVSPWTLCSGAKCLTLGAEPGPPIEIRPCPT